MNNGLLEIPKAIIRQFRTIVLGNPSGNLRGVGAVEIIPSRTTNTQVASGTSSIAIGDNSSASASSAIALGSNSRASGQASISVGNSAVASIEGAVALGDNALSNGVNSLCVRVANTNSISGYYAFGHSSSSRGRHQRTELMLYATTTSTADTRLTSNGATAAATNQLTLRASSAFRPSQIDIVAYDTVTGTATAWEINNVLIKRGATAGTTALVGTPTVTVLQNDMATAPTLTVSADTVNGALGITVASPTTNTTRYTAIIRTSEVGA